METSFFHQFASICIYGNLETKVKSPMRFIVLARLKNQWSIQTTRAKNSESQSRKLEIFREKTHKICINYGNCQSLLKFGCCGNLTLLSRYACVFNFFNFPYRIRLVFVIICTIRLCIIHESLY